MLIRRDKAKRLSCLIEKLQNMHLYNMKQLFFTICLSLLANIVLAQSKGKIKLYAYQQSVSKGKAPEVTDGPQTSTGTGRNYWIYTVAPGRIYPAELWLDGTRYGVTFNTIKKTPLEWEDAGNIGAPKKILVPKSTGTTLQVVPTGATDKTIGKAAASLARSHAVVLVYKQNGKFYYVTQKTWNDMESTQMQ
jgi:hypothetical protein